MANCTRNEAVYETVKTLVKPECYILTLSLSEASALYKVLNNVGGHPKETRRGLIDNIRRCLDTFDFEDQQDLTGSVRFINLL